MPYCIRDLKRDPNLVHYPPDSEPKTVGMKREGLGLKREGLEAKVEGLRFMGLRLRFRGLGFRGFMSKVLDFAVWD